MDIKKKKKNVDMFFNTRAVLSVLTSGEQQLSEN